MPNDWGRRAGEVSVVAFGRVPSHIFSVKASGPGREVNGHSHRMFCSFRTFYASNYGSNLLVCFKLVAYGFLVGGSLRKVAAHDVGCQYDAHASPRVAHRGTGGLVTGVTIGQLDHRAFHQPEQYRPSVRRVLEIPHEMCFILHKETAALADSEKLFRMTSRRPCVGLCRPSSHYSIPTAARGSFQL